MDLIIDWQRIGNIVYPCGELRHDGERVAWFHNGMWFDACGCVMDLDSVSDMASVCVFVASVASYYASVEIDSVTIAPL